MKLCNNLCNLQYCSIHEKYRYIYSASHSRVAPENVGLQKEQKCNTFACHTCKEVRLCVLFSGFASCCAQYNNTQQSTTFCNQTPECSPFYYYYTALHVSAYRQAIIKCYIKVKLLNIYSVDPLSHDIHGSNAVKILYIRCIIP
jgi:hypothetical protein